MVEESNLSQSCQLVAQHEALTDKLTTQIACITLDTGLYRKIHKIKNMKTILTNRHSPTHKNTILRTRPTGFPYYQR
nr:hypothetical protein AUSP0033_00077 [uncultured phage]